MEFDLPNEIIQRIQSFLDGDEAAQTCLLSKSWYGPWSTRPILIFKRKKYPTPAANAEFWNYVGKTMKRYKQLNIKLEKLVLGFLNYGAAVGSSYGIYEFVADASAMCITDLDLRHKISFHLLREILAIQSLTKLSVVLGNRDYISHFDGKVLCSSLVSLRLHGQFCDSVIVDILLGCPLIQTLDLSKYSLSYKWKNYNDIVLCPCLVSLTYDFCKDVNDILIQNIMFRSPLLEKLDFRYSGEQHFIFPSELFAMRSFTNLSISRCALQIEGQRVLCSRLLSLSFSCVEIGDDAVLRDILLGCPLVQNFDMKECKGVSNIDVSKLDNLVANFIQNCSYRDHSDNTLYPPKVSSGSTNVPEFHKLCSVLLSKAIVNNEFFNNFSARFPRLKDLTLEHCTGFGSSIHISSHSLEYIQLHPDKELQKVEFDVPNIRKFVFETCDHFPSLSFHTTSMDWESKVKLTCSLPVVKSFWFVKLREFLKELSLSRISLSVNFEKSQLIWVKDFPWLPTPVVEDLKINNGASEPVTHDLLCALFRSCRPTLISIRRLDSYGYSCAKLLHVLFLINQKDNAMNAKWFNKMQSLLMHDLEEIDLERSEGTRWQSTPLSKFIEDADPVFEKETEHSIHSKFADDLFPGCEKDEIRLRLKWGAFRSCTS